MIKNKIRTTFANEDFLDFYFNGKKASEMGLIKVNTGKRQDEELLPSSKDTTIDVPGADGSYYLTSKRQPKEFTINFNHEIKAGEKVTLYRACIEKNDGLHVFVEGRTEEVSSFCVEIIFHLCD